MQIIEIGVKETSPRSMEWFFSKLQEKYLLSSTGQKAKKQICSRIVIRYQIIEVKDGVLRRDATAVACLISGKLRIRVCHM